jgi:DNA-binding transcriptional MerR regulator
MYSVKKVAELSGVSVRTLHHYDEIGLLPPSTRTGSGYRRHARSDLLRLQEILAWRQLGFSLRETRSLLDDPGYDRGAALRRQRQLALAERKSLRAMIAALDAAIAALEAGTPMEEETMFEGFDPDPYAEETQRRYGGTSRYAESKRRTAGYGEAEWKRLEEEADEIARAFAGLRTSGARPDGAEALAAAERHRRFISRWFYDCPPPLHRGLGELYVADGRFRASWDRHGMGLAEFVRDAVAANAAAAGAAPA